MPAIPMQWHSAPRGGARVAKLARPAFRPTGDKRSQNELLQNAGVRLISMVDASQTSQLNSAVRKVMAEEKCEIILYSGPVEEAGFGKIVKMMPDLLSVNPGCILVLVTYGGLAGPAYRISRLMQDLFNPFTILISGPCKSAGTLLATGAHKIVFFPHSGELGPLDVQLYKRDEIGERRSGLVTSSAIDSLGQHAYELFSHFMLQTKLRGSGLVRFRTATDIAAAVATGLFGKIYEKIDPDTLGEEHRDTLVAVEYARRLCDRGGNIDFDGINRLVYEYPSHDFVIDYAEAASIFKESVTTSQSMSQMVSALGMEAIKPSDHISVRRLSVSSESQEAAQEVPAGEQEGAKQGKPNGEGQPAQELGHGGREARTGNRGEGKGGGRRADSSSQDGTSER